MTLTKRATRHQTSTATIRSWRSQEGGYSLQEVKSLYGLPTVYLVVQQVAQGGQIVISRHRKLSAAQSYLHSLTIRQ